MKSLGRTVSGFFSCCFCHENTEKPPGQSVVGRLFFRIGMGLVRDEHPVVREQLVKPFTDGNPQFGLGNVDHGFPKQGVLSFLVAQVDRDVLASLRFRDDVGVEHLRDLSGRNRVDVRVVVNQHMNASFQLMSPVYRERVAEVLAIG